ncbi:MAG: hypothetical protein ACM3XM_18280 [Mycobacterium leprae]
MSSAVSPVDQATSISTPLQTLTQARFLLIFVDQSILSVLNQTIGRNARVPETLILVWRLVLRLALQLLNSIPSILIFPPPRWVTFVQAATTLITQALQILDSIPVASTRIFPPTPGTATVDVLLLQQVETQVRFAALFVEAAERELAIA